MQTKPNIFTPFEIAQLAKQAGFNEPCLAYYHKHQLFAIDIDINDSASWSTNGESLKDVITAPTWGQLEDWLRIEHNQYAPIVRMPKYKGEVITGYTWAVRSRGVSKLYDTYEDARLDLFIILLKRVIENG